jgi:hypothetical protein
MARHTESCELAPPATSGGGAQDLARPVEEEEDVLDGRGAGE